MQLKESVKINMGVQDAAVLINTSYGIRSLCRLVYNTNSSILGSILDILNTSVTFGKVLE